MSESGALQIEFLLVAFGIGATFFVGSIVLMNFGRYLGARHLAHEGASAVYGHNVIDSAVFALLGLLLAFVISGSLQRFDERRQLILQEMNAISTAYDRLDQFESDVGSKLKTDLKNYLQARIKLYHLPIDFSLWSGLATFSTEQQAKIRTQRAAVWNGAIAACPPTISRTACTLLLPSLNSVFEAAQLRAGANERHPPLIIYLMLFGLGFSASLVAGFGMAATKRRSWVHMLTFAGSLAFVLYVVTDLEYPRLGLIRTEAFDHFLIDLYNQLR